MSSPPPARPLDIPVQPQRPHSAEPRLLVPAAVEAAPPVQSAGSEAATTVQPAGVEAANKGQSIGGVQHESSIKKEFPAEPVNAKDADKSVQRTVEEEAVQKPAQKPLSKLSNLEKLIDTTEPEPLENGVQSALKALQKLQVFLAQDTNDAQIRKWLDTIAALRKSAKRTRTVVGVVGNTGAGKSSLINAMLDQTRLLPTNGVRACTAVVTEMSWNASNDPKEQYRAEIEFISREDWSKELHYLFGELFENQELSHDYSNSETEAGVAYAKIRAVFPQLTRNKALLKECTPTQLATHPEVLKVLSSVKTIAESCPLALYQKLQLYLDSTDKEAMVDKASAGPKQKKPMAFWPLIKVVRVYVKADILSTGIVLVDLPGIQDANAARSAVADSYMVQCTAIWVVAPIQRAISDKSARNLLGNFFKLQLKMDGSYRNVTFICSKTDDIVIHETAQTLDHAGGLEEFERRDSELVSKIQFNKRELKRWEDIRDEKELHCEAKVEEWKQWKKLARDASKGRKVYAPVTASRKRKQNDSNSGRRVRRGQRCMVDSDSDDSADDETGEVLTADAAQQRVNELKAEGEVILNEFSQVEDQVAQVHQSTQDLIGSREALSHDKVAYCIRLRNDYSRDGIRRDFVAGRRELDQEEASQANPEAFDPDQDLQDYDEVAQSLQVFCISSRGYQQACGRGDVDNPVKGFRTVDDSEIPQLRAYAKKLTEGARVLRTQTYLSDFNRILNTLIDWSTQNTKTERRLKLNQGCKEEELAFLQKHTRALGEILVGQVNKTAGNFTKMMDRCIINKEAGAILEASRKAPDIVAGWGAKVPEGGVHWTTYRSTCKHKGDKTKGATARDFNQDLTEPFLMRIATGWEKAFSTELPRLLDALYQSSNRRLLEFHETEINRPNLAPYKSYGSDFLTRQAEQYSRSMQALVDDQRESTMTFQRDANRHYTPVIKDAMSKVYKTCSDTRGPGSFATMKNIMDGFIRKQKTPLYKKVAESVRPELQLISKSLEQGLQDGVDKLITDLEEDWRALITGETGIDVAHPAREEIRKLLSTIDAAFGDTSSAPTVDTEVRGAASEPEEEFRAEEVRASPVIADALATGGSPADAHSFVASAAASASDSVLLGVEGIKTEGPE